MTGIMITEVIATTIGTEPTKNERMKEKNGVAVRESIKSRCGTPKHPATMS
jgi:cell division ATPase FtsA